MIRVVIIFIVLFGSGPLNAQEISSYLFSDTIRPNGIGNIDLFSPKNSERVVTGAILEAFRTDNNGKLVFAVDVNEASDGSEFSDSQGIAIDSAILYIEIGGVQYQFTDFYTPTKSLLAKGTSTDRIEYYTLIGNAGTNRISPNMDSELNASSLDETLYFSVDRDISLADKAWLEITLLTTNTALGDPEAFYDFSNGFEEVAILTKEDVAYLELLTPGRLLAPLVISDAESFNWVYYPSSQNYYVASYEDLYPIRGDYDFNDLVVAYQVGFALNIDGDVEMIRGNGYLMARGAMYDHDWYLGIELPVTATASTSMSLYPAGSHAPYAGYPVTGDISGTANLKLVEHVAQVYEDGGSTYVNTFDWQSLRAGPKFDFQIAFDSPVKQSEIGQAPFDPFLYVHDTGYEVHLVGKQAVLPESRNTQEGLNVFRDEAGFPFAIVAPDQWYPPLAGVDMGVAYPNFLQYVQSLGSSSQQWYAQPDLSRVKSVTISVWKW